MAGLLSRFTKNGSSEPATDLGSTSLALTTSVNDPHRMAILDSLEETGLSWFWASDADGRLIYLSAAALEQFGAEGKDLLGTPVSDLFEEDNSETNHETQRTLRFMLAAHNSVPAMPVRLAYNQREVWWEISGKPYIDKDGKFAGYRGIARDISEAHQDRRDAERLSQFDGLTGLSNRHRMAQQITAMLKAFRVSKRSCALMMLDLDRFKQVNDTLGHPAGDELLKQVSARLGRIIGSRGEIGRFGGDEFQIVIPDLDDRGELGELAQRLVQMISQPYSIDGTRAVIGTSIGIAVAPYDGVETEELIKAADLALYAAKGGGRGQHRFYSTDLQDQASHRHQIEADLRDAVEKDELRMHFQPIVNAQTHEVECMEALMRWEHSTRGMISPGDFIPIAEEVGLIRELGEWALNQVCHTVAGWPSAIGAAVNVSAVQFASDDFVDIVRRALKTSKVNPAQIELEITESVFVGDIERSLQMFHDLKKLGVKLALDDFGTGYSSLSYLRDAPFDKIKIDQCFVRGCAVPDNNNLAIVASVVSLAQALRMQTVAEGVETKDELQAISEHGVSHIQGIIFSRAVPIEETLERFERGDLKYTPRGPEKYRSERRTEFRKIGLIHGDHRYTVVLRNLSKTGAKVEGLLGVSVDTKVVLDLGGGQLAVATVRRSEGHSQGLEFETPLISDGNDGLCTRHRVSPYQIELAGRPLEALGNDPYLAMMGMPPKSDKAFVEVHLT